MNPRVKVRVTFECDLELDAAEVTKYGAELAATVVLEDELSELRGDLVEREDGEVSFVIDRIDHALASYRLGDGTPVVQILNDAGGVS